MPSWSKIGKAVTATSRRRLAENKDKYVNGKDPDKELVRKVDHGKNIKKS